MTKKKNTTPIYEYKLKNGEKRYGFNFYIGIDPLTGDEKNSSRRGFKTKKEAELERARILLAIKNGTFRKERAET